jgi:hypothetical protein
MPVAWDNLLANDDDWEGSNVMRDGNPVEKIQDCPYFL